MAFSKTTLPPPSDDDPSTQTFDAPAEGQEAAVAIPEGDQGEGGKLKMIVQLVKRCLGVKDIAAMRLSLPASLLEPMPNLEYWHYVDRPDLFAAINDSPDELERMLAVLRFTLSKDLKFIRGKICKPYNSVLGEHYRCQWNVKEIEYPDDFPAEPPIIETHLHHPHHVASDASGVPETPHHRFRKEGLASTVSFKSAKSSPGQNKTDSATGRSSTTSSRLGVPTALPHAASAEDVTQLAQSLEAMKVEGKAALDDQVEESTDTLGDDDGSYVKVVYLTEQISHHPPASSYYMVACGKGVEAAGVDQISAKVAGTSVRISPGNMNQGIFVSITSGHGAGEVYHITHPSAYVNGILRGSFYPTMTDYTSITCIKPGGGQSLRALIEYKDESWIGKPQFLLEGAIHTYDSSSSTKEWEVWTKVKAVPSKTIVANFNGAWRKEVKWKRAGSNTYSTLIDIDQLSVVPKSVRPLGEQLPDESRKLWEGVTSNLLSKSYNEATKIKQAIEQKQRDIAADRKAKGVQFVPKYFEADISSGRPVLTELGRKAVEEETGRTIAPAQIVSSSASSKS